MSYNINGWVEDKDAIDSTEQETGVFGSVAYALSGTGKGKVALLYKAYKDIGLIFPVRNQGNIGSCVSFGVAGSVDVLKAQEIANGDREQFNAPTAEEPIYYGARVKIGGNRIRGDGAIVAYAVKYITQFGTIAKGKYGTIDLSTYSVDRCRKWGTGSGFPKTIEDISKEHVVKYFTRVKSWDEYRDSIANGYPVVFGSSYGFSSETDDDGFCRQNTTWQHCMFGMGVDDQSTRKGGLISNSWGANWLKIRKRKFDQPDGCFWVDDEIIDKIMRNGDAWSIGDFDGYKKKADMSVVW